MSRPRLRCAAVLAVLLLVLSLTGTALALGYYEGPYMGSDGHQNAIHFTYHGTTVRDFKIGHHVFLAQGHVSNGTFSTSQNGVEFFGVWETSHHVTGWYRYYRHHKRIVVHWETHAYAT
jgi:hypothetical protein